MIKESIPLMYLTKLESKDSTKFTYFDKGYRIINIFSNDEDYISSCIDDISLCNRTSILEICIKPMTDYSVMQKIIGSCEMVVLRINQLPIKFNFIKSILGFMEFGENIIIVTNNIIVLLALKNVKCMPYWIDFIDQKITETELSMLYPSTRSSLLYKSYKTFMITDSVFVIKKDKDVYYKKK